ncbi:MAG: hypothetical protein HC866_02325 [Leptolyngbyaceae cyanobacterium RU_5_1]|nr:hypothetical protein [Leptolyngbyaceae cyanobacterium RU_5_1]
MTLRELQKQVLQLSVRDRWQLVQTLLESLEPETRSVPKQGSLSRLRGIAKGAVVSSENMAADYITYLSEKYQ